MSDRRPAPPIRLSQRLAEIRAAANVAGAARQSFDAAAADRDMDAMGRAATAYSAAKERLVQLAEALETDGVAEFLESWVVLEEELHGMRLPAPPAPASDKSINGL